MHKVIDSNYLRGPELRQYLAASNQNIAVLTDYGAMEPAYFLLQFSGANKVAPVHSFL